MNDRREGKSFEREISLFKFPLARIIHALIYGWNWNARQPRVPSEFRRKNLRLKFPFSINSIRLQRSTQGALTMITNVRDWKLKKNFERILERTWFAVEFREELDKFFTRFLQSLKSGKTRSFSKKAGKRRSFSKDLKHLGQAAWLQFILNMVHKVFNFVFCLQFCYQIITGSENFKTKQSHES